MTREERVRVVDEAIAFLREGYEDTKGACRWPGAAWDETIVRVLLECTVVAHPRIRLLPVLANFTAHWTRQPTSLKLWFKRWQNWTKNEWDPLISGERQGQRQGQGQEAEPPPAARPIRPIGPIRPISPTPVAVGDVVQGELAKIRELIK